MRKIPLFSTYAPTPTAQSQSLDTYTECVTAAYNTEKAITKILDERDAKRRNKVDVWLEKRKVEREEAKKLIQDSKIKSPTEETPHRPIDANFTISRGLTASVTKGTAATRATFTIEGWTAARCGVNIEQ